MGVVQVGRISPERVVVAASGGARLRVAGRARGFLRVDSTWRWVWGDFDEIFVIAVAEDQKAIDVSILGIGSGGTQRVQCHPLIDIQRPTLSPTLPVLRSNLHGSFPSIRRLEVRPFTAPRVMGIAKAQQHSLKKESEDFS
jgi:hypothetical protein